MTDGGSGAVLVPSGRARRAARGPRRRVGVLLVGMALMAACGVGALGRGGATSPILRTVMVGGAPELSLALDDQTSRAFVFNRQDATLSVLDTETGALLRTVSVGQSYVWLAVDRPTRHVFVSSYGDGTISMLDARSGSVLRTVSDSDSDTREIKVDERINQAFVGHRDSSALTVLDGRTGIMLRHLAVCGGPSRLAIGERTGHLFAKCNDGTTDMLDARTGRLLRQVANNSGPDGGLTVDEYTGRVFTMGDAPQMDVLDARTGAYLRNLPQDSSAGPVVDERTGNVYCVLGDAGAVTPPHRSEVLVFDGHSGALLHRFPVPANPISLAVDSRTGRVLVGSAGPLDSSGIPTSSGTVSVLDGTSGRVLRTLQVGFTPTDIAVDVQHRRALVVSSYTDVNGGDTEISRRPRESWWPQVLRRITHVICCLPFRAPAPPAPTTDGTVTTIDLTRL